MIACVRRSIKCRRKRAQPFARQGSQPGASCSPAARQVPLISLFLQSLQRALVRGIATAHTTQAVLRLCAPKWLNRRKKTSARPSSPVPSGRALQQRWVTLRQGAPAAQTAQCSMAAVDASAGSASSLGGDTAVISRADAAKSESPGQAVQLKALEVTQQGAPNPVAQSSLGPPARMAPMSPGAGGHVDSPGQELGALSYAFLISVHRYNACHCAGPRKSTDEVQALCLFGLAVHQRPP
jgi:hypothetical protein